MGKNRLGDRSGQAVGAALLVNRSLQMLDISDNHLTMDSCEKLGMGIRKAALHSFIVRNNKLGDGGIKLLCKGLRKGTLTYLDLRGNSLTRHGYNLMGVLENSSIQILLTTIGIQDKLCDPGAPREIPCNLLQSKWDRARCKAVQKQLTPPLSLRPHNRKLT
jgi:hypothetical protein